MIKCLSLGWKVGSDFRGVKLYLSLYCTKYTFFLKSLNLHIKKTGRNEDKKRENRKVNALKKAFFVHYIIYISKGQRPL